MSTISKVSAIAIITREQGGRGRALLRSLPLAYNIQPSLKVVTNEKGEAVGESPNHYMLVGEVVLDVFLSF